MCSSLRFSQIVCTKKKMKITRQHIYIISFLTLGIGCRNYAYLGEKPPKHTPKIFAPGIISLPDRKEEVITFSQDLKEIYYSIEFYPNPKPSFTIYMTYENGNWSHPQNLGPKINSKHDELGGDITSDGKYSLHTRYMIPSFTK